MPTPTPTEEQIESVREIARLSSFVDTETKVSSLKNAQWAATLADITEWNKVKNKFTKFQGGRSGVVIDKSDNRLEIRNRVRTRLGLAEVDEYGKEIGCDTTYFPSVVIKTNPQW